MAGVIKARRGREKAGEVAAVERDPAATAGTAEAKALPDPSVVVEPDEPRPVTTAAPSLAAEPDALDVIDDVVAQVRGSALADPLAQAPHPVIEGQTMLAVEPGAVVAEAEAVGALDVADSGLLAPGGGKVQVVEVVGPQRGRRRAGFTFGPQRRRFLRAQLTDAQFDAIVADPMLVVGVSEIGPDVLPID